MVRRPISLVVLPLIGLLVPCTAFIRGVPTSLGIRSQRRVDKGVVVKGINLEGIPIDPSALPEAAALNSPALDPTLQSVLDTAVPLATLVVGALVAAELSKEAPSGWVSEKLVEAAPSTLGPKAGRGLYALEDIPAGTIIGSFPGFRKTKQAFALAKTEEAQLLSLRYAWRLDNGDLLDPTDATGTLPDALLGYGGLLRVPTLLALVNEPPPGVDTNLVALTNDKEVLYQAERDIYKGEELFIDYGPDYPRQHYSAR